jgi:hypothetical protein
MPMKWGVLVLLVAGCAGAGTSVAVPVHPMAKGQVAAVTEYGLQVDGQPGGRFLVMNGGAIREQGKQDVIRLGVRVENTHGERAFTIPTRELYLSVPQAAEIRPAAVDSGEVPSSLQVGPGESRTYTLTFALPGRVEDVRAFELHWALDVDGATERITRQTAFLADRRGRMTLQQAQGYDLPSRPQPRGQQGPLPGRDGLDSVNRATPARARMIPSTAVF